MFRAKTEIQKATDRTDFLNVIFMCINIKGNYHLSSQQFQLKKDLVNNFRYFALNLKALPIQGMHGRG
jgi:hypothetical protein